MRILIENLLKRGIFLLFPLFVLTACTNRNDMVLELDAQDSTQQKETLYSDREPDMQEIPEPEALPAEIYVHICGAVAEPGVYVLAAGSRIFEGIEAAGGFRDDACEDFINLAQTIQDGQRIVIPTVEEAETAAQNGVYVYQEEGLPEETQNTDGRVNINTASEQELSAISGIGAGKAAAIVQYRQENGNFSCIEDVMKVSGIKEGTYEKIKDKITVN